MCELSQVIYVFVKLDKDDNGVLWRILTIHLLVNWLNLTSQVSLVFWSIDTEVCMRGMVKLSK